MVCFPRFMEQSELRPARESSTAKSGPESTKVLQAEVRWRRHLAVMSFAMIAATFVLCSGFVLQCYRTKAAWYAPVFWPSSILAKGPLKADWGNAF